MPSCEETRAACVGGEDVSSDNGRLRCNHPNPNVSGVAGGPVIDTPVLNLTDGSTFKFQCTVVPCKPRELNTTSAQNENDNENTNSEQAKALNNLLNRFVFRPHSKKIEIIFAYQNKSACEVPHEIIVVDKLVPASRYKMQITHFIEHKLVCNMEQYISTKVPFGPPENFYVTKGSDGSFHASWKKPQVEDGCEIIRYIISVCPPSRDAYNDCDKYEYPGECQSVCLAAGDEKAYTFEIQACSDDFISEASKQKWSSLKHDMLMDAKIVGGNNVKPSYLVNNIETTQCDDVSLMEIGKQLPLDVTQTEKVVLIVGETGTGKTTWINAFFNYLIGVKYADEFRFKLVIEKNVAHQEFSQTQNISMYKIHPKEGFPISYALTLIDTPGFGDPRGVESDESIKEQLVHVFAKKVGLVNHLNAIVFMTKASNQRLHPLQQYICSSVLELFGNDIKDSIFVVFSHGSISKPQALAALSAADFPYKSYFKFDHAAIFEDIQEIDENEDGDEDENGWRQNNEPTYKMGMKNFEKFLSALNSTKTTGISSTRKVLEKRLRLQQKTRELEMLVHDGLKQMEDLMIVMKSIKRYDNALTITSEQGIQKVSTRSWVTVCLECKYTCHEDCLLYFDFTKGYCDVMDRSKSPVSCTKCPQKCTWKYHKNLSYIYKEELEKVINVLCDRKECYGEMKKKKITAEETCENIRQELFISDVKIKGNLSEIAKCVNLLNKIGLKKDKISPTTYIDTLITGKQKNTGNLGRDEGLAYLHEVREQAASLSETDADDPFSKYGEAVNQIYLEDADIAENEVWKVVAKYDRKWGSFIESFTGTRVWKSGPGFMLLCVQFYTRFIHKNYNFVV